MTDGNTATQVSPVIQEDEMGRIREIFERTANAIVQATELAREVNVLREEVNKLRQDIQRVKDDNHWLETTLNEVRAQRDQAQVSLDAEKLARQNAEASLGHLHERISYLEQELALARSSLDASRRECDDYMLRHMEAEERAKVAEARLAEIGKFFAQAAPPLPPTGQEVQSQAMVVDLHHPDRMAQGSGF